MKILLAGGGTAGSVSPLIAVYEYLKGVEQDAIFVFIGTKNGYPEKEMLRGTTMNFIPITAGKMRRYFDAKNIIDFFKIFIGFIQSLMIMFREKPDLVIGTGGYVQVPVIWAAWVKRIKILIHQQDISPSLSNILCLNLADKITVSFEKSLRDFPSQKTVWTGNPIKTDRLHGSPEAADQTYDLEKNAPVVLITGGGTGALGLNTIVNQSLPDLIKICQVVMLTGQGKKVKGIDHHRFKQFEFVKDGMNDLLARADLVISRAGLSTISELSALGKLSILVPMPNTHQEKNAVYLAEREAAIVINQLNLSPTRLVQKVEQALNDKNLSERMSQNMSKIMKKDAASQIGQEIINLLKNESK